MRTIFAVLVITTTLGVAGNPDAPVVDLDTARGLLSLDAHAAPCAEIACLLERAYRADPQAQQLAVALWHEMGDVAGVGPDEQMDGGYRGRIHLVPELPVGRYRAHLAWVAGTMRAFDQLMTALFAEHPAPRYRWRGLAFRFVRSVGKRTPSAYATGWAIEYNVSGSLLIDADGVRDTLVHELFHSNDEDHGDWSAHAFQADYDAIVARCGGGPHKNPGTRCLAPYAPGATLVRGGTYYAFQQDNGKSVREYAAELAVRYFAEQREMLSAHKLAQPAFKCGPAENARAWQALVDEFFAGRDLVPACERAIPGVPARAGDGGAHS